jgi:hypothetical protein
MSVRKKFGEVLVELGVPRDDDGFRCRHGFVDIHWSQDWLEAGLRDWRSEKNKSCRRGVSTSWRKASQFVSLAQKFDWYGFR